MIQRSVVSIVALVATMCVAPASKADPAFVARRTDNQRALESVARAVSMAQLEKSLRVASLTLLSRDPRPAEIARLATGLAGYRGVITEYLSSDAFRSGQLSYYRNWFEMAGTTNGINFDEPANLATYLAVNDMDFRGVLTADYCIDGSLNRVPCSAFQSAADVPLQAAGVLTTRAFLSKWVGPFNFKRVDHALRAFACRTYPDERDTGLTEAEISNSVKTFASTTATPACYACHRTMNPRAALFYSFDRNGFYNPNPRARDGTLTDVGAVSTRADLLTAGAQPRYHGAAVTSVRQYAERFANTQSFRDCLAQRLINQMLGRPSSGAIPAELQDIRDDVAADGYRIKAILFRIATHPAFISR